MYGVRPLHGEAALMQFTRRRRAPDIFSTSIGSGGWFTLQAEAPKKTRHCSVYTDAYSKRTPGPGGWAVCIYEEGKEPQELSGGYQKTTYNRLQILSVIKALQSLKEECDVHIFSRSEYVCNAITKRWLSLWEQTNWMNREKQPIKNRDLWQIMLGLVPKFAITMHVLKSSDERSNRCEILARECSGGSQLEIDSAYPAGDGSTLRSRKKLNENAETVIIHTDGSCLGNPGPGGWACVIEKDGEDPIELSGGYRKTTNNRMEILSVIEALSTLDTPSYVELFSDSQYVCNAIEKRWLKSWLKNNWMTAARKPVKNQDLWRRLNELLENHSVSFCWLRGHAGQRQNERCDELAREQASRVDLPEDEGFLEA